MPDLERLVDTFGGEYAKRQLATLKANALRPPDVEAACEELKEKQREIDRLTVLLGKAEEACANLNVQARFWRQASAHAVDGWNALEDKHEALLDVIKTLLGGERAEQASARAALESYIVMLDREEQAPPINPEQTVDLGDGVKLRVVEEETPR